MALILDQGLRITKHVKEIPFEVVWVELEAKSYHSMRFRHFLDIFKFPKILSLFFLVGQKLPSPSRI